MCLPNRQRAPKGRAGVLTISGPLAPGPRSGLVNVSWENVRELWRIRTELQRAKAQLSLLGTINSEQGQMGKVRKITCNILEILKPRVYFWRMSNGNIDWNKRKHIIFICKYCLWVWSHFIYTFICIYTNRYMIDLFKKCLANLNIMHTFLRE